MSTLNQSGNEQIEEQEIRDRTVRIFTYLRELTELRSVTVRTIDSYEKVLWLENIPREEGCYCVAWKESREQDSETWVEIKKPRLKPPPKMPEPLIPWLKIREVEDSSLDMPVLQERISVPTEDGAKFLELREEPSIKPLWETYVQKEWWPWAEVDRKLQSVQNIYTDMFTIYQKQQRLGEAYEVVLGLGYLTWKNSAGLDIKRHIIAAHTNLTFDAIRGTIAIGPAGEGAKLSLEQDMLEPQERPSPEAQKAIESQIAEIGDALWDNVQLQSALKAWVHSLSPRSVFEGSLIPQNDIGPDPQIRLAPAIILRKRTERSLLRIFKDIIEDIQKGRPLPTGVKRLVTIMEDADNQNRHEEDSEPDNSTAPNISEIYFPLPANDEQQEIVRRLGNHQGVLVQGPPGTGKSHTIANLICHLLAEGNRVLVTSHTARALKVLKGKIPKEVSDLCVVLLGDDLNAMQALEDSVRGITEKNNAWNPQKVKKHISDIVDTLDQARRDEAEILANLRSIREAETYQHPPRFGDYQGTAQSIAQRLRKEDTLYSWISESPSEDDEPPLTDIEAKDLLNLLRVTSPEQEAEARKFMVSPDELPATTYFSEIITRERELLSRRESMTIYRNDARYTTLKRSSAQCNALKIGLGELITAYDSISKHIQPCAKVAATQILADRDRMWRDLIKVTRDTIQTIKDRTRWADELRVKGLENRDRSVVKAHAEALLRHREQGGGFGFWHFRPKVVKDAMYLVQDVRVNGILCDRIHALRELLKWIEIAIRIESLSNYWSQHINIPTGSFSAQAAEYEDCCEPIETALQFHDRLMSLRKIVSEIPGLIEPTWHDIDELRTLHGVAESVILDFDLAITVNPMEELAKKLSAIIVNPTTHPVARQFLEAVTSRDENMYLDSHQCLQGLCRLRESLGVRDRLMQLLCDAAPELALQLKSTFPDSAWDTRMDDFVVAWNWARTDGWIRRLANPEEQEVLNVRLDRSRNHIRDLIRDLAAEKAWSHCLSRLTEPEREHLEAWKMAVRKIGKGTGKYAPRHRRAARDHMEQCRSAIPAWIMPIYRVAETIRPGAESFDVIIVDEASQSGPEALFLYYLGKKLVVVGDDKQISPDSVGLNRDDVELLRQRHISDIPHSDVIGVDNSFFDFSQIRYGSRIRLREHFRCMPEIIQYSNNLCYPSEPLIPLRQYGLERLTPVVLTQHITDGYQKGNTPNIVNPPEAEAVVRQIQLCCNDPIYAGKTMGVISLLGEGQARMIEHLLLERVGPEEMEKRQIICGDAYAFQGDERDVMFLSLVSAPIDGRRMGTLTTENHKRRFNVAASRAKDQMWLFHTVTLNDISPVCLRHNILEYCMNPKVQPTTLDGLNIDAIRMEARSGHRDKVKPPYPFGSWFEVDVFQKIVEKGYRVIPQFEIAGRRIDLVIEGMRGRLAVECDGDMWHGMNQYESDLARQRMLERCGLIFWRIRGSAFYREPDAALEDLWNKLDYLGISNISRSAESRVHTSTGSQNNISSASPVQREPFNLVNQNSTPTSSSRQTRIKRLRDQINLPLADSGRNDDDDSDDENNGLSESAPVQDTGAELHPATVTYRNWDPKPLPDPRISTTDEITHNLVDIITAEGPILCHRAYHLYINAAGLGRVGKQLRSLFNKAIHRAIKRGALEESDDSGMHDQQNKVVRIKGTPPVILRSGGNRKLGEIPPSEIGMLMNLFLQENSSLGDEDLFRLTLVHYGFVHLTQNVQTHLSKIRNQCCPVKKS